MVESTLLVRTSPARTPHGTLLWRVLPLSVLSLRVLFPDVAIGVASVEATPVV